MKVLHVKSSLPGPQAARRRYFLVPGKRALVLGVVTLVATVLVGRLYLGRGKDDFQVDPSAFSLYILGSSTAIGYPYYPRADIGRIASVLLADTLDGRPIQVVNLAGPGKTARVVLRDARDLVSHSLPRERSLAFLHIGNNEFARLDRRHNLTKHERTLFDESVVSPGERRYVEERYRADLASILSTLQDAGIAVVVSTVAVNLKDWEPNRSVLANPIHADSMKARLEAGDRALAAGNPTLALAHFQHALALEPRFALASKKAGDCCRALHRIPEARRYFQAAVDNDGNPLRDTSQLDAILRQVCAERGVPLLDAVRVLESASSDSLVGYDLLWDNCHPTFGGYVMLGRAFAELVSSRYKGTLRSLSSSQVAMALGLNRRFEQRVLTIEGQYLYGASTLTFDPRPRLSRARGYLEEADSLGPDAEVACSLAVLAALEGDARASLEQWRRALNLDAQVTRDRMQNPYVAQVMSRVGVTDLVKATR